MSDATFLHTSPGFVGAQLIADTSTTQKHPIGTRVRAASVTYGEAEFIYLKGLLATAIGTVIKFDEYGNTTKIATSGDIGPVAVAMSANVASQYGWYQIGGAAVVKSGTVAAANDVYVSSTPGTTGATGTAGDRIDGARYVTANGTPSTGLAVVQIDRPAMNGGGS